MTSAKAAINPESCAQAARSTADEPAAEPSEYSIGDLAREFDVSLRTLRHYETKGLLHPRRVGSTRIFSCRDRSRLKLALLAKPAGLTLDEIKEVLDLCDLSGNHGLQLRVACDRLQMRIGQLIERRSEIDAAIDELARAGRMVEQMLRRRDHRSIGW